MLNKIRGRIEPIMNKIGIRLASSGISPNTWTVIGFLISVLAGITYATYTYTFFAPLYGGILLIISGFFDIIDGSVARVTQQITKKGAFLDSTLDRVSEIVIYAGILYSGIANGMLILLAITSSLLVSYARARAESLGIELKGIGIGERAERLLILAVTSILATMNMEFMNYGIAIIGIVASITFIQRILSTINKLS